MSKQPPAETPDTIKLLLARTYNLRRCTEWEDDWDGEGSVGYTDTVVDRASNIALSLWLDCAGDAMRFPVPGITPGPHGSIDIHWRIGSHDLLINVDGGPEWHVSAYGDAGNGRDVIRWDGPYSNWVREIIVAWLWEAWS